MTVAELEKQAMEAMLSGNNERNELLLEQYEQAQIQREYTGVGFVSDFTVPEALQCGDTNEDIENTAAYINDRQIQCMFRLVVRDGFIKYLEAYTTAGSLPEEFDGGVCACGAVSCVNRL